MKATCPGCGFSGDLEAFINDAHWRAALVPALSLPSELAPYVVQYLRLFSPAKQGLRAERAGKILAELADCISQARVERNKVQRVAPLPLWKEGIEEVLLARDAGTLELPFKGHGYLFQVVHSLAGKAAGRDERSRETRAQGNTPVGISNAHKQFKPEPAAPKPAHNPAAAAKALADMKSTLTKGAL
jgi:hypothetical protein